MGRAEGMMGEGCVCVCVLVRDAVGHGVRNRNRVEERVTCKWSTMKHTPTRGSWQSGPCAQASWNPVTFIGLVGLAGLVGLVGLVE
jgi:hypothetical protein